jgi:hypothetical protein
LKLFHTAWTLWNHRNNILHNGLLLEEDSAHQWLDQAIREEYYLGVQALLPCQHWYHFIWTTQNFLLNCSSFANGGSSMLKLPVAWVSNSWDSAMNLNDRHYNNGYWPAACLASLHQNLTTIVILLMPKFRTYPCHQPYWPWTTNLLY